MPTQTSPLRRFVQRALPAIPFFCHSTAAEPSSPHISDAHIDAIVHFLDAGLGMGMLIAPLWMLGFVEDTTVRLSIITSFLIGFFVLLTFTTVGRPFESLGATAASVNAANAIVG